MPEAECFLVKRPLVKEDECGDTGFIKEFDNKVFLGIIDVLGHGKKAYKITMIFEDFLKKNYNRNLIEIIKGFHECIKGLRGAAVGLCLLDLKSGELKYAGMGNITARKFGACSQRLVSRSGVIGYEISTPKEEIMKLCDGDVFLLYTDGVQEHFELEDYPEILNSDARTIAKQVINKFGKKTDDALCIALRYRK